MRMRFKLVLNIVAIFIIGMILIFASSFFYQKTYEGSIVLEFPLTINYTTSEVIDSFNYTDVKFSVTNSGDTSVYYNVGFNKVETKNEYTYTITNSDDSTIYDGVYKTDTAFDYILIEAGDTHNYVANVDYDKSGIFKGEIVVKRESDSINTFANLLKTNNEVKEKPFTTLVVDKSTTDEGLIEQETESGYIYYFRGAIANNYFEIDDLLFRIVKINQDDTIKLVLDSEIESLSQYYDDIENLEFKNSAIHKTLEEWFDLYLSDYSSIITNHLFCNDNSVVNSELQTYAAYNRIMIDDIVSFECIGDEVSSQVGLLTVDEVIYAGANNSTENSEFYLTDNKNENSFYLMSSSLFKNGYYYPFMLDSTGEVETESSGTLLRGVRPVINITRSVEVFGTGTLLDPYTIKN